MVCKLQACWCCHLLALQSYFPFSLSVWLSVCLCLCLSLFLCLCLSLSLWQFRIISFRRNSRSAEGLNWSQPTRVWEREEKSFKDVSASKPLSEVRSMGGASCLLATHKWWWWWCRMDAVSWYLHHSRGSCGAWSWPPFERLPRSWGSRRCT